MTPLAPLHFSPLADALLDVVVEALVALAVVLLPVVHAAGDAAVASYLLAAARVL